MQMRRPRALRALTLGLAVGLAATGALPWPAAAGSGPSPSAAPSVPPPGSGSPAPGSPAPSVEPVPPVGPPEVRLLDAGSRPRQVRRFSFEAGQRETMVLVMSQSIATGVDGSSTSFALPPVRYVFEVEITDVADDGTATADMVLTVVEAIADPDADPPTDPALIEQLNAALEPLVGLRTTSRIDRRGGATGVELDTGSLDPQLAQQMTDVMGQLEGLAIPLPVRAIGVGARWETLGSATLNGLTFTSRQVITLRRVQDGALVLDITTTQEGVPGEVELPGLPAGVTARLDSLEGTTTGQATLDLRHVTPRSDAEGTIAMTLTATDGTTEQQIETTVESRVTVRRGP